MTSSPEQSVENWATGDRSRSRRDAGRVRAQVENMKKVAMRDSHYQENSFAREHDGGNDGAENSGILWIREGNKSEH